VTEVTSRTTKVLVSTIVAVRTFSSASWKTERLIVVYALLLTAMALATSGKYVTSITHSPNKRFQPIAELQVLKIFIHHHSSSSLFGMHHVSA